MEKPPMHVLTWMITRKKLSCTCGSKLYSRVATGGIFYLNFVSLFILLENSNTICPLMNLKRRTIFETIHHIWFGFWVLILLVVVFFLSTCVYADLVMFLLFVYQYLCLYGAWGAMIQLWQYIKMKNRRYHLSESCDHFTFIDFTLYLEWTDSFIFWKGLRRRFKSIYQLATDQIQILNITV
jgi:hypothetical protein